MENGSEEMRECGEFQRVQYMKTDSRRGIMLED